MYRKITAAIASTIMIVALLMSLGAAAGDATMDNPSPALIKDDTTQKFTITVTNPSDTDNIDNIEIFVVDTPGLLSHWTGGSSSRENLLTAAGFLDNLEPYFVAAGENVKLAADNWSDTASDFTAAGENLATLDKADWNNEQDGPAPWSLRDNMYNLGDNASVALKNVGSAIDNEYDNLDYIGAQLNNAYNNLDQMAGKWWTSTGENLGFENLEPGTADNLDNAASDIDLAADNLGSGNLSSAAVNLSDAAENLTFVGDNMEVSKIEEVFKNMASSLTSASDKLDNASAFLQQANSALGSAESEMKTAASAVDNVDSLDPAGSYLDNAADNLGTVEWENAINSSGDNLWSAADDLDNAAGILGASLGGDELATAASHLKNAAENARHSGMVNLTNTGSGISTSASYFTDAAGVMEATADGIGPAGWRVGHSEEDLMKLDAINEENELASGASTTLSFIADVADISSQDKDYTIQVRYYKEGQSDWFAHDDLTLTVDGKKPAISAKATQENTGQTNLINSGTATLTITASEKLSSLGPVHLKDKDNLKSFSMSDFSTDDNKVWTTEFDAGAWDENSPITINIESATDRVGNENKAGDVENFTVDTKAPTFKDNGLSSLVNNMSKKTTAAGTTYKYVDNKALHSFAGKVVDNRAGDNVGGYENVTVTVEVDGTTFSPVWDIPSNENRFFIEDGITLPDGVNMVTVMATDLTGNSTSDNIENIMIDTTAPSVSFDTIAGKTWDENKELINDNSPTFSLTISDSGLGVPLDDNLEVQLDNNDNFRDGTPYMTLENGSPYSWDAAAGQATFENTAPDQVDDTYWITGKASDNIWHDGENYVFFARSFKIDSTPPSPQVNSVVMTDSMGRTIITPPLETYHYTDESTLQVGGGTSESGSTVRIYRKEDGSYTKVGETTDDDSNNEWSMEISDLKEGKNVLYLEEIDKAGNSSGKDKIGTVVVDTTAPTITLSDETLGLDGTSTGKSSVKIGATIEDKVSGPTGITVSIRADAYDRPETKVSLTGKTLSMSVPLVEGTNTIDIVAKDKVGNTSKASITGKRTAKSWPMIAAIAAIVAIILAAIAVLRRQTA